MIQRHKASSNNIDLIRFALASMVAIVHAKKLLGDNTLALIDQISSTLAVEMFFVISGLLITRSYEASSSLLSYASKRFFRIYPAYVVVIVASAFFGCLYTEAADNADYVIIPKYLAANLTFLNFIQPTIPGVFSSNPYDTINGALWTLKIEFMFYLIAPFIVIVCGRQGWFRTILAVFASSVIYRAICNLFYDGTNNEIFLELGRQLPGQFSYFCVGIAIYYADLDKKLNKFVFLGIGVAALLISHHVLSELLRPLAIGLIFIFLAFGPFLGRFGKYGDFSYGLYITHFPIIQIFVYNRILVEQPLLFVILAYFVSLLAGVLLWHFVEKHMIRRRSRTIALAI
jgi:peptidoglycan/LPS O-acetylase OafA/YrhL